MSIHTIPIHLLDTASYCEYQIFLKYAKGVSGRKTDALREGSHIHHELLKEHEKSAEGEMTVLEAMDQAHREGAVIVMREVGVRANGLTGYIDELHISPDGIYVIDDKSGVVAYQGMRRQVWAYCLALREDLGIHERMIAVLRDKRTMEVFWADLFTEVHEAEVVRMRDRIIGIIEGSIVPTHSSNVRKCVACRFYESCDVRREA